MPSVSLYLSPANLQVLHACGGVSSRRLRDLVMRGLMSEQGILCAPASPVDDLRIALMQAQAALERLDLKEGAAPAAPPT